MPEIITIIFDCYNPEFTFDPLRIDDQEKCEDASEALIEFLDDHHISYYYQSVTKDELHTAQEGFDKKGMRECGG